MTVRIPLLGVGAFLCAHQTAALNSANRRASNQFEHLNMDDDDGQADECICTDASKVVGGGRELLSRGMSAKKLETEDELSARYGEDFKKQKARRASKLLVQAMAAPEELSAAGGAETEKEKKNKASKRRSQMNIDMTKLSEEEEAVQRVAAEAKLQEMMSPDEAQRKQDEACAAAAPPIMQDTNTAMGHFRAPVELPAELAVIAERELNETSDAETAAMLGVPTREVALLQLRERLEKLEQTGVTKKGYLWKRDKLKSITFARKDDQFLICFLRARKFRIDDAEKLIVNYTNFVHKHAEILTSLDCRDPFLDPAFMGPKAGVYQLPGTTRAGGRMIGVNMKEMDKRIFDDLSVKEHGNDYAKLMIRQMIHIYTKQLSDPWFQVKGVFFYQDFEEGPSLQQIYNSDLLTIEQKKDVMGLLHDTIPMRFNGVVMMNEPWYVSTFISMIKPFMNQKLRDRIFLLGSDVDKLHAIVDPAELPPAMHGTLNYEPVRQKLTEYFPKWKIHACSWAELGISASHVKTELPHVVEDALPPYNGSEKVKSWIIERRRQGDVFAAELAGDAAGAAKAGKKKQRGAIRGTAMELKADLKTMKKNSKWN